MNLSRRAMSTPEPLVRTFARRVQQEGALDLTQGDYRNEDFAPHPEVVRSAQRITRNTVHSYGPAVGRMDVRTEIAEFFNRDGVLDYPKSDVRFSPDEVVFTPGTRAGLATVLEVLGEDGTGVIVPRPSWEYDWFVQRAGKRLIELHTSPPEFLPDPDELRALLRGGGVSSVILNNPHNPSGRVYPRPLLEEFVRICVEHGVCVLYDCVYQRLDFAGAFVNPAFADPEWRHSVVTLSGLSKMDMFGASTGTRACWLVISDAIESGGLRAIEPIANLSAWLVATPSTLSQDWALAALQSPLAAIRRPSPYMRERRDFMARAADALAHLGVERTDFAGTFYAPLAFPGLVGEPFERVRNGLRERAVVRTSEDVFDFLLAGGVGGIPFAAFAGSDPGRYGTWQRLSFGSKDVKELAVFMERLEERLTRQGRLGASAPASPLSEHDRISSSASREGGYEAFDELDPAAFAARRSAVGVDREEEALRITATKHPDSSTHRAAQLERAMERAGSGAERAAKALACLEWNPLVEARDEYEETLSDLLGPCNEALIDFEGRHISPEWLALPEKVVLALLRHGVVPGAERFLLCRVPNPWIESDEEKLRRILAAVGRTNLLALLAAERLGYEPRQNAIYELCVPQINARCDVGALVKIGQLYLQALAGLLGDEAEWRDLYLQAQISAPRRRELIDLASRVRLVPLVENVGALLQLPELIEEFWLALDRNEGLAGMPTAASFATSFDGGDPLVRVFVAMSDTAQSSGKIATDGAMTITVADREECARRLASRAARRGLAAPRVTLLIGAGRAGFRGGFDPRHEGVIDQLSRAGGITLQGIRADHPDAAVELAAKYRSVAGLNGSALRVGTADREVLRTLVENSVAAHTETLLRIAPFIAPFGGLVPQTRVRIQATGSAHYGRSIPEYPEEWRSGPLRLPDQRLLRDSWPEGVTLPRTIVFNLACTTLGLPAVTSDLAALDKRGAVLLERLVPGYREVLTAELPLFVGEAVALLFGRRFAEIREKHLLRSAANLWTNFRVREELVAPTCLFTMLYLRYIAEESVSWDETKEHESRPTRESELIRDTSVGTFAALCAHRPGERWDILQTMIELEDSNRLVLARELTIEEKRELVDLVIDGWLRTLPEGLSFGLRREWSLLRELPADDLTLRTIKQLVDNEQLRGGVGA